MEYLIFAALLGLIPAFIAKSKGREFGLWWFYGFMLWIVALIHSFCLTENLDVTGPKNGLKKCPNCFEWIKEEAVICKHCNSNLLERTNE